MGLPTDGFILPSYINTKLRDGYDSLEELCSSEDFDVAEVKSRLLALGYEYDSESNSFKLK